MEPPDSRRPSRRGAVLAFAALLVAATALAYANSLRVPFLLDDASAITGNRTIAGPIDWGAAARATGAGTASGRPLLNLSFALNELAGGRSVVGYHLFNLGVHIGAGLLLFGIVRRTLLSPKLGARLAALSAPTAATAALVWLLHPVQTEAVTYVSQRAESMMGLFYLLTLYGFVRAASADAQDPDPGAGPRGRAWLAVSLAACVCGTATKEVMVTAPVLVLLYDRTFVSGTLRQALRSRPGYYLGLAASWILLALLLATAHLGDRTVGIGQGVGAWAYLCTQVRAWGVYARVILWPSPLIFDYGREALVSGLSPVLPEALLLAVCAAAAILLWRKAPPVGFLCLGFFLLLSPTSTVIPIAAQPIAESRLYLPLALVAAGLAAGTAGRFGRKGILALAALAALLGALTASRNRDYASAESIWRDTVAKNPGSSRAHEDLAVALAKEPGRGGEALAQFREALRIRPDFAEAHRDIAVELAKLPGGRMEAIGHYRKALALRPAFAEAHNGLGVELGKLKGRSDEALAQFALALEAEPDYAEAHNNLAVGLARVSGRLPEAVAHLREALRIDPGYVTARCNLARLLSRDAGGLPEAVFQYREALRADPGSVEAHGGLARLLVGIRGREAEGIAHFEEALARGADRVDLQIDLANALLGFPGRLSDAVDHYRAALAANPDLAEAHNGLGVAYAREGDRVGAVREFESALALRPGYQAARDNLRALQAAKGNPPN